MLEPRIQSQINGRSTTKGKSDDSQNLPETKGNPLEQFKFITIESDVCHLFKL
jgi:hypothetical protein